MACVDADAYYGIAGEFVRAAEPFTESDPVALLVTFLNAFGNAAGRNAYVKVGGDHHHANLYACLVGASSRARKGTSLGIILDVFASVDVAWNDRRVNGLSSGEGVIAAVKDTEVKEEGGTFSVSGGVIDKRLWIVESEFGQVLKVLKRDGNTLSSVLRNAWDRGELHVLTRREPLKASGVHASILGHITAEELARYLAEVDVFNGFANRFLWTLVKRSKLLPRSVTPDMTDLRQRLAMVTQKAQIIGEMTYSPSAAALWDSVYDDLVAEKRGLWDAVTSRGEAQTLRLSMAYALLDGSATIDVPHLRAALALWRFCDDSARIIFGTAEGDTLERKIRRAVAAHPGLTRTEIRNAISHKLSASDLNRSLRWLVKRNDIVCVQVWEGGRQAERYYPGTNEDGGVGALGAVVQERPTSASTVALGAVGALARKPVAASTGALGATGALGPELPGTGLTGAVGALAPEEPIAVSTVALGALGALAPASPPEKPNAPNAPAPEGETKTPVAPNALANEGMMGTPAAPNAPNAPAPNKNGDGRALMPEPDGSRALTADEFLDGLATVQPATLAELLEWRNSQGASFECGEDGVVRVKNETGLTPALKAAVRKTKRRYACLRRCQAHRLQPYRRQRTRY